MPLLDHFRPPLGLRRHWDSFLASWAVSVADQLNGKLLPKRYFAELHFLNGIEKLTVPTWVPPLPAAVISAVFPDELEVLVFSDEGGPTLVAALEFVSPGNKDRDNARQAFLTKCVSYLQQGIGLLVVDVVTIRLANLHNELMRFLGANGTALLPDDEPLYTAAYRPARRKDGDQIDVWPTPLALGQSLPTMPLALRGYGCVPVDLEASYTEARQRLVLD